jgi:hypothetical protein
MKRMLTFVAAALVGLVPAPLPAQPIQPAPAAWIAFQTAWANDTAYTATVAMMERDGTQEQNSVLDYTFQKPANATVHFVAGTDAGVTVVWNGGETVIAHRGAGLMAMFKKSFPLHDPQVTTIRGSSIDQLSFAAFIAHARDTPGIVTEDAGPTILNVPTVAVTLIPASPAVDTGLTREVIDLAVTTNLPLRVLGYVQDTLVREIDFTNIQCQAQ